VYILHVIFQCVIPVCCVSRRVLLQDLIYAQGRGLMVEHFASCAVLALNGEFHFLTLAEVLRHIMVDWYNLTAACHECKASSLFCSIPPSHEKGPFARHHLSSSVYFSLTFVF
jgi:hypothetical protein